MASTLVLYNDLTYDVKRVAVANVKSFQDKGFSVLCVGENKEHVYARDAPMRMRIGNKGLQLYSMNIPDCLVIEEGMDESPRIQITLPHIEGTEVGNTIIVEVQLYSNAHCLKALPHVKDDENTTCISERAGTRTKDKTQERMSDSTRLMSEAFKRKNSEAFYIFMKNASPGTTVSKTVFLIKSQQNWGGQYSGALKSQGKPYKNYFAGRVWTKEGGIFKKSGLVFRSNEFSIMGKRQPKHRKRAASSTTPPSKKKQRITTQLDTMRYELLVASQNSAALEKENDHLKHQLQQLRNVLTKTESPTKEEMLTILDATPQEEAESF